MKNMKDTAVKIWQNVTIEPVVMLYLTSIGLNEVIRPNLLIEKACLQKLNFSQEVCEDLNSDEYDEQLGQVQEVVSDYERNLNLMTIAPRVIYALIAGAWSDRNGRKFIIAMPIFGQCLVNLTYIVNYTFLTEFPFEALYMEFINELCGTFVVYYLAVYSYMADVSSEEDRTFRISVLDGTDYIFTMVGTAISAPIFKALGYYAIFSLSAISALSAVLYVAFIVKESVIKARPAIELSEEDPLKPHHERGCCKGSCLKPQDTLAGFKCILKRRPNHNRMFLLLLVVNFACYIFAYNGTEGSHRYLFVSKKYGWDEEEFTRYLSFYRILYLITLWILLPSASKVAHFHDATIAIVACLAGAVGQSLPAFFEPAWVFYFGAILSCLSPAATITARSMASRCVTETETGTLFSLFSLMSAVSSSLISAMYQQIYNSTLNSFVGTFLLVNAGFFLVTIPSNIFLRKKL